MNNSDFTDSQAVVNMIEELMGELEKAREENQTQKQCGTPAPANLSDEEKELHHDSSGEGQSLLPRMGPRTREEKISAYKEEIKRILHETIMDQNNLEYYESQQRHYKGELAKLQQANYPDPKAEVLKAHFLDELERIQYELFNKLGTGAEQTLRKKLRVVRIDNIASQLSLLTSKPTNRLSEDSDTKFPDNEDSNGTFFPDHSWAALDDSFAASPTPSSVSMSSYCRPWLRDHPASEVSIPHSQISSSGSLPRPHSIKGKGEAFQEKFKRMQHYLLPSTAANTVPITVKFRTNSHRRSSSITKLDSESSPGSSLPHRPVPVCPIRSSSLTGADLAGSGNRHSIGERLNASMEKGDLREARSSINSSEERMQASLLSGVSDATDEMNDPYSPARLSIADSDNIQDITELVQSTLTKFDTNEYESFACTLQSVTQSPRYVKELYKKGVMERSIRLLHGLDDSRRFAFHNEIRDQMTESLYNIVRCIYRTEKLALQIHHNVSMVRDQCQRMMLNIDVPGEMEQSELHSIREKISTSPFIQLNTFSSKPEASAYLTQLGVLYALSEYLVVDQRIVERLDEKDEPKKLVYIKRLICATLRNMTFRDPKNKVSICLLPEVMECLIAQLESSSEELLNSTASLLRNLAWNAEDVSKVALNKCSAVIGLVEALQRDIKQDIILVNITNGLVNLTQHSPDNKLLFCAANFAIHYMIKFLSYKSPDGNSRVIENITGLFCNVSQHIASTSEHVKTIREQGALGKLVDLLTSDNNYVLMHVCGILNNLSASNSENVKTLWSLRAPQFLEKLKLSDNGLVSERAGRVLKHLIVMKDGISDDSFFLNDSRMESIQDASLFEDELRPNFETELEPSPIHNPRIEVTKVKVKDGMSNTPVKGEIIRDEDLLSSNEKIPRKSKESSKRSFLKKLSFARKSDNVTENNTHFQEVRFSLDTSPKRATSSESDMRSVSVKTPVPNPDLHTPQSSPMAPHYLPNHYTHPEAYSRMLHAKDVMSQYPYPNSYQSYPHHLIDMPPQPSLYPAIAHSPYIGYMHHYIPNYHHPHRFHNPIYSPRGSPGKGTPHVYGTPPLRPNHFPHPPVMSYRQQTPRMPTNPNTNPHNNQLSRHDADMIKSRLDKHSKDRSYTDSQGDLVTDL